MDLDGRWALAVAAVSVVVATVLTGVWSLSSEQLNLSVPVDPRVHPRRGPVFPPIEDMPEAAMGRYREAPLDEAGQLAVIGYTSGSREAGDATSVTVHDERAWDGLNLYTSGHEPIAFLLDMDGNEIWRWHRSFDEVWPDFAGPRNEHTKFWRRVHLLEDGSLLAIFEGIGLIKLSPESELLWARPNAAHHDLQVLDDGTIWVLSRRSEILEEVESNGRSVVDYLLHLDPEGRELERISLMTAYANSRYTGHYREEAVRGGDSFHTNTVHVIEGAGQMPFVAGNLLVSMRHLNTIAVLDPRETRVLWSLAGDVRGLPPERRFAGQHDPQLLDDGNLLLFDNGPEEGTRSRVVEFSHAGRMVAWSYSGTDEDPLWSRTCGTVQRLPNGNTLITESDGGRALEVTRDGETVWEFHNPARPEERPDLVATLFEMERLPPDFPVDWLPESEDAP